MALQITRDSRETIGQRAEGLMMEITFFTPRNLGSCCPKTKKQKTGIV